MDTFNVKQLNDRLDPIALRPLFKTKPVLHALALVYNWAIILGLVCFYQQLQIFYLYPVVVVIIGARMHALTVLMHDATHYRFLKHRKWNDWVSNIFTMYPIFTSIEKYRANHLKHHQHLNSDDDPDWVAKLTKRAFQFPKTKQEFLLTIGSYLTFYQGILDAIWFAKRYKNVDQQVGQSSYTTDQIIFYGIMFIVFTVFQLWQLYLLFWLVPYLTTFFMFQYIRSVAEHYGELAYEHDLSSTRTVVTNRFEQFLFAPHAVNYHLEHHLYPGVPFYNLPKLHRLLMELPAFRQEAHITNGYFSGLLNELGALQVEAS